ncbi:MAG TPA: isoprenylcysteine carboxylmethyltransferase family protein [Xanthobacteraceae bacterium]|nr:isoprenylcysteine carboxylmethyltransferase family protein [Xanthobacteraceae bacterium]
MENQTLSVESRIKLIWNSVLEADNHIVGLFICVFAVIDWTAVYDGIEPLKIYFSQGIYTVPSLSALNKFFSAVYLTLAAIILLSLRPPLSRYQTALPNLVAVLAAFAVYIFVYVPQGNLFHTNIAVALALTVSGAILVIGALVFLRQAFTVTPQARFLVTAGPYSIVRHPMYVGNIVSILGLALLIDSLQAMLLFLLCSGLQAGRALYEERLLAAQFP